MRIILSGVGPCNPLMIWATLARGAHCGTPFLAFGECAGTLNWPLAIRSWLTNTFFAIPEGHRSGLVTVDAVGHPLISNTLTLATASTKGMVA